MHKHNLLAVTATLILLTSHVLTGQTPSVLQPPTQASQLLKAAPSTLSFSPTRVGSDSDAAAFDLINNLPRSVQISSIVNSPDFAFVSQCGSDVGPWTSCPILVTFHPTTLGPRTGTLTITVDGTVLTVDLSGKGNIAGLKTLSVTPVESAIQQSEQGQLKALGTFADGAVVDLSGIASWSSTNATVAGVDGSGLVTANGIGNARITAHVGKKSSVAAVAVPGFETPSMLFIRIGHSSVLRSDGKVHIFGGFNPNALPTSPPFAQTDPASTEVFDPATRTFSAGPTMSVPRPFDHVTATLPDGKILIAGGTDCFTPTVPEILDPATNSFRSLTNWPRNLNYDQAFVKADGQVLLVGGHANPCSQTSPFLVDIYDPQTDTLTSGGTIPISHFSTLLEDGRVLIVSGKQVGLYDPKTQSFHFVDDLPLPAIALVLLNGGRAFALGQEGDPVTPAFKTVGLLFDPVTNTWTTTSSSGQGRTATAAILLQNGNVALAGGRFNGFFAQSEFFDTNTLTFNAAPFQLLRAYGLSTSLLNNGEALLCGGRLDDAYSNGCGLVQPSALTPLGLNSIVVHRGPAAISIGESRRLSATGLFDDDRSETLHAVAWSANGCSALSVTPDGFVFARESGECTVTATAGHISGKTRIRVP